MLGLLLGGVAAGARAQVRPTPAAPPAPIDYSGRVEYDSFFGLYPTLSGTRSLDSLRQLTGYGTYYTQPGGSGLEVGASYGRRFPRRGLTLAPAVGLLSGGFFGPGRGFLVGEGYTASLAAGWAGPRLSLGALLGYYGLLRRKTPDVYDIVFYHVEVGCQLSKRLAVGGLHEQIRAVRRPHNAGDSATFQLARVGLFARGALPGHVQLEVAGGWLGGGFVRASLSHGLRRARP